MKPIAYVSHPLDPDFAAHIKSKGFTIIDMAFAPDPLPEGDAIFDLRDIVTEDLGDIGTTGSEGQSGAGLSTGSGALSTTNPPSVNPNIGTDSGDGLSDDQLRDAITEATGAKPHHKTGREKLIEQFNALNLDAAKAAEGQTGGE